MDINATTLRALHTAYRAEFNKGLGKPESTWKRIATTVPSTTATNVYPFLGQFFKIREWLGDRVLQDFSVSSYSVDNKAFEGTVSVDRNYIEDDQYALFSPLMETIGTETALFPDDLLYTLLSEGKTGLCYDGLPFFSTQHKSNKNTTPNLITGSANPCYLIDDRRPIKPLIYQNRRAFEFVSLTNSKDDNVFHERKYIYGVDGRGAGGYGFWQQAYCINDELNEETFNEAYNNMCALRGDNGSRLGLKPMLLICGASNRVKAHNVVLSEKRADNTSNPNYKIVDVLISPYLD